MRKRLLNEWIEDDRDYEDWELDEEHINLYGGDPTYCPECHERLSYGDGYPHCLNPECGRYSPIDFDESLSEKEMRDLIKHKGHEKFVKELSNDTASGYKKALQYVYDQDTLSKDDFKKKYFDESLTEDTLSFNPRKNRDSVKRPTTVKTYRNKRNPNKKLDVRNDGYGHNSVSQYMNWKKDEIVDCGDGQCFTQKDDVLNKMGDGKHHRWRKDNLNDLLDDYELEESVQHDIDDRDIKATYGKSIWDMTAKELVDNNLDDVWFNMINDNARFNEDELEESADKNKLKEDKAVDVTINTDELTNNGFATEAINLINATWDIIKSYKSALVDIDTYEVSNADEFKTIINTIIEDSTANIGKLQAVVDALTPAQDVNQDIQDGVTEAETTMETNDDVTDEDDTAIEITASEDDELDELDEAFFNELLVDNHKN